MQRHTLFHVPEGRISFYPADGSCIILNTREVSHASKCVSDRTCSVEKKFIVGKCALLQQQCYGYGHSTDRAEAS